MEQVKRKQSAYVESEQRPYKAWNVQLHIHPLVSLIVVGLAAIVGITIFTVYALSYHADFIVSTLALMHDGWWLLRAVCIIGLVSLSIHFVAHPLIDVFHKVALMVGQFKRNRVLSEQGDYALVEHKEGIAFHQVTQERNTYHYKGELLGQGSQESDVPLLDAPKDVQSPTQAYAINQLQENGLQVCLGVDAETGEPYTMNLLDGTHYKFIGASGMGKSCMAGSILDQVTQANDEQYVQIALLDLEHKTSRLFEHLPHVAELQIGRKRVECVATTPDEVGEHLGYLHMELDRRKALSEYDLVRERFLLIYVEEFLSLKREISKELKEKMLADFSILAMRGRKYGLYLLACSQVDYASKNEDLRDAQNQFNVNGSFSVRPTAARAAGFYDNRLLKSNFEQRAPGRFVLQTTGHSGLMLAPVYDVREKLLQLDRSQGRSGAVHTPFSGAERTQPNAIPNANERAWNAIVDEPNAIPNADEMTVNEIVRLHDMGWKKQEIVEKVFACKKGSSAAWKEGSAVYDAVLGAMQTA